MAVLIARLGDEKKYADSKIKRYFDEYTSLEIKDISGILTEKWKLKYTMDKYLYWVSKLVKIENRISNIIITKEEKQRIKEEKQLMKQQMIQEKQLLKQEKQLMTQEKLKKKQERQLLKEEQQRIKEGKRLEREERKRVIKIDDILKEKWVHVTDRLSRAKPFMNEVELKKVSDLEYLYMADASNLPDFEYKLISDEDTKAVEFRNDVCAYIMHFFLQYNIDPLEYIKYLEYDLFAGKDGYINTETGVYYYKDDTKNIKTLAIPVRHKRNFDIIKRLSTSSFVYDKNNIMTFVKKMYDYLSINKADYLITYRTIRL